MAQQEQVPAAWVPNDTFGARLALVRNWMHWNVKEAGVACAIAPASWRNWEEGGEPRRLAPICRKIADCTGCDYQWLMIGGPLQIVCNATLTLLSEVVGQTEFNFEPAPVLALVDPVPA